LKCVSAFFFGECHHAQVYCRLGIG
jgi:hypothetical protein